MAIYSVFKSFYSLVPNYASNVMLTPMIQPNDTSIAFHLLTPSCPFLPLVHLFLSYLSLLIAFLPKPTQKLPLSSLKSFLDTLVRNFLCLPVLNHLIRADLKTLNMHCLVL